MSEQAVFPLVIYDELRLSELTRKRAGETRLGEMVKTIPWNRRDSWEEALADMPGRYVLLGLPEDIGVRANYGRGGAYSARIPAISTILNTQSNPSLHGEEIIVLGHIDFSAAMEELKLLDPTAAGTLAHSRELTARIDQAVFPVMEKIIGAGKEAIVIGGGHNNAYGNLRGLSAAMKLQDIACINCDAHSDLRPLEGRHSGNGFSYALHEGYLQKYAMVALHEMFNMDSVFEKIEGDDRLDASWFEEIFIREEITFREAVDRAIDFTAGLPVGLEIDLDAIQNIPSSAKTSSGISTLHARQLVHRVAISSDVRYLHLAEAAPVLSHIKTDLKTGKLIAYLVADYIKARNQRK